MKKIFMMMAAAACIFSAACEKESGIEESQDGDATETTDYLLTSTPLEGSQFEAFTDTEMRFVLDGGVLKMNKVKFAERMPRLDIEVPGVTPDKNGVFAAESIIPTYVGQPMAQYVMTGFKMSFLPAKNRMEVEFDCMTMHVTYTGLLQYEFAE